MSLCLQPGEYAFQYVVDGSPQIRGDLAHGVNESGWNVNQLTVAPCPDFQVFYNTGWERCQLSMRHLQEDGTVDPLYAVSAAF